jgi:hypothetical protein
MRRPNIHEKKYLQSMGKNTIAPAKASTGKKIARASTEN